MENPQLLIRYIMSTNISVRSPLYALSRTASPLSRIPFFFMI
jgi:hypothetical protein